MEHLFSGGFCHGEWTALLGLLYALPVLGVYARTWFHPHTTKDKA